MRDETGVGIDLGFGEIEPSDHTIAAPFANPADIGRCAADSAESAIDPHARAFIADELWVLIEINKRRDLAT